jgi:hypothetical protein
MHKSKLIIVIGVLGAMTALSTVAQSQSAAGTRPSDRSSDTTAAPGCSRPEDTKDAKVVELDTEKSLAKLAVNLGSNRFKLVRITVWDRPEDPRPLIPVIQAARITQGLVQFYSPTLNNDPESAHDAFLLMVDMGGGTVCWATPASLIVDPGQPSTEGKLSPVRSTADPTARSTPEPNAPEPNRVQAPEITPALAPRRSRTPRIAPP